MSLIPPNPPLPSLTSPTSYRDRARCHALVANGTYTQTEIYAIFFPTRTSPPSLITLAKSICKLCPVSAECLDEAITYNQYRWGILGGMTAEDRRRIVSTKRREYAANNDRTSTLSSPSPTISPSI